MEGQSEYGQNAKEETAMKATIKAELFDGTVAEVYNPTAWERMDVHDRRLAAKGYDDKTKELNPEWMLRNFGTELAPIFSSDFRQHGDYAAANQRFNATFGKDGAGDRREVEWMKVQRVRE